MTCIRAFDAFVNFQNGTAPLEFYGNLKDITEVVKTGWLMSSLVIGDALVVSIPRKALVCCSDSAF